MAITTKTHIHPYSGVSIGISDLEKIFLHDRRNIRQHLGETDLSDKEVRAIEAYIDCMIDRCEQLERER